MRALILEDESAIQEVETAYMQRAGFQVTEVTDGKEALIATTKGHFDLFILDINVPGLNGLEVCRRIRSISLAPIILITARNKDIDELAGLEYGADDYIKKPFNPDILVARANALLRRHGEQSISLSGITVDPSTRSVIKEGREVPLSTIQFNILYLLASNPGKVFRRSEIVDRAWGNPFDCNILERTVDSHIKRLRRVIGDNMIHTIIGTGYSFPTDHA